MSIDKFLEGEVEASDILNEANGEEITVNILRQSLNNSKDRITNDKLRDEIIDRVKNYLNSGDVPIDKDDDYIRIGSMKAPFGSSSPTWELYHNQTRSGVFVETGTSGELIPV